MHPVMPFVTEALWKKLNEVAPQRGVAKPKNAEHALITAAWPDASAWPREAEVEREMEAFQNVIRALRDKRADVNRMRVAAKESAVRTLPKAVVRTDADTAQKLNARMAVLQRLGQCDDLEIGANVEKPPESASAILSGVEVYVPLTGLADLDIERKRLSKERRDVQGHLQRLRGKLANEGFVAKAPPAVVEKERARLGDLEQKLAAIARNLTELGG
jgi:valyl-tRNA synthetase